MPHDGPPRTAPEPGGGRPAPVAGHPFADPGLPVGDRVADLLGRLTLDEKVSLLHQYQPAVPRLGLPAFRTGTEALHGVAWLGEATVFPQAVGLGSTWDPALLERVGTAVGDEVRAFHRLDPLRHGLNVWAPVVNLLRDPRWGRNEEGYSEDPLLTGALSTAYSRGLAGGDPDRLKTAPVLKHFLAHNNETDRVTTSSSVPDRVLREYDLEAFRPAIAAGAACGVMPAYNLVNGRPNHVSPLLDEVLRGWAERDLLVVSDAYAPSNIAGEQRYHPTHAESHAASLKAGVDSFTDRDDDAAPTVAAVKAALAAGLLDEADVDRAAGHLLAIRCRLGDLDPPGDDRWAHLTAAVIAAPEHAALAREAARRSIVLLKNDPAAGDERPALPLRPGSIATVAVVGPLAGVVHTDWYSGTLPYRVTPRDGIADRAGPAVTVTGGDGADRVTLRVAPTGAVVTAPADPGGGPLLAASPGDGSPPSGTGGAASPGGGTPPSGTDGGTNGSGTDGEGNGTVFAVFDWGEGVVALRAEGNGLHVGTTEDGTLVNDRPGPHGWVVRETFALDWGDDGTCALRSTADGRWVTVGDGGRLAAVATGADGAARFTVEPRADGVAAAAEAAAAADVAVVVVGNHPMVNGRETQDRRELVLPPAQRRLVRSVLRANPRTVLVLVSSYPFAVGWEDEHVPALLWTSHGGQELGNALADVLFGDHSPAGRLPQTWPRSLDDLPGLLDYDIVKAERTYLYSRVEPLYPFGHGLGYTWFDYRDLRVEPATVDQAGGATVRVEVANAGEVAGDEVVQLYVRPRGSRVRRPARWLRGFERLHLRPGERRVVAFELPAADLAYWDVTSGAFAVEPGRYEVLVGASSLDIRGAGTLTVTGAPVPPRDLGGAATRAAGFDDSHRIRLEDETRERGDAVASTRAGGWIAFDATDLDAAGVASGGCQLTLRVARAEAGGSTVRLVADDPVHGRVMATAQVPSTGDRYTWTSTDPIPVAPLTGVRDLYLVFGGRLRLSSFTLGPAP